MLKVTDKYYIDADDKYFNVVEKAVNHKTGKITSWNRASFKKIQDAVAEIREIVLRDKIMNNEILTLSDLRSTALNVDKCIGDQMWTEGRKCDA